MRVVSNIEHIVASHAGDRILIGCERQRGASRKVAACPGFKPAARLLKRSVIRRCVSLLSRENSLFG